MPHASRKHYRQKQSDSNQINVPAPPFGAGEALYLVFRSEELATVFKTKDCNSVQHTLVCSAQCTANEFIFRVWCTLCNQTPFGRFVYSLPSHTSAWSCQHFRMTPIPHIPQTAANDSRLELKPPSKSPRIRFGTSQIASERGAWYSLV